MANFTGIVVVTYTLNHSFVLYSAMVVLLTTCSAFDLFLEHPAVVGALSDHRSKRYAPVVRLRDFDGELDFLTSLELKHGLQFAQNHSSPKYMLDLYSSMETGEDRVHPSSDEVNAITDSDTVRSFTANVKESNATLTRNFTRVWTANFRITSIKDTERVRLAELRILLNLSWRKFTIEVALHHWTPAPCPRDPSLFECFEKQLIISRLLPTHRHDDYDGGEVFDVTEGLRHWFRESPSWRGSYELEIRTKHTVENPKDMMNTETDDVHSFSYSSLSSTSSSSVIDEDLGKDAEDSFGALSEVVLVVFSRTLQPVHIDQDAESSIKVRAPRAVTSSVRKNSKKSKKHHLTLQDEQERLIQDKLLREILLRSQDVGTCRKVEMEVDFYNNGWERWIVYPKRFNAYRCAGRCSGPLSSKDNPSNHAIMQNMVRAGMLDRAPEPCCIPTKLSPLSMIYLERENIVMRHHEEMIVEECGCR